jgi:hypothetical protein
LIGSDEIEEIEVFQNTRQGSGIRCFLRIWSFFGMVFGQNNTIIERQARCKLNFSIFGNRMGDSWRRILRMLPRHDESTAKIDSCNHRMLEEIAATMIKMKTSTSRKTKNFTMIEVLYLMCGVIARISAYCGVQTKAPFLLRR